MDQRRIRRVIAAAALTMTLALASPALAAGGGGWGPDPGLFNRGWQWLTAIWPWTASPQRAPATRQTPRIESKRSAGIDPNGAQITLALSPDGSTSSDTTH